MSAILLDIEGTIGSVSFVKEVMFPYARERLFSYVADHDDEPRMRELLAEARVEAGLPVEASVERLLYTMRDWLDADRKVAPLKELQGWIWKEGFRSGPLRGHLYDDAVETLRRWHSQGLPLWVYSSGSVEAQHLYFEHSVAGDVRPLFWGHFDTRSGNKKESASYTQIAAAMGCAPGSVAFLSDSVAELDAASLAGMRVVGLDRGGDLPQTDHPVAASLPEAEALLTGAA